MRPLRFAPLLTASTLIFFAQSLAAGPLYKLDHRIPLAGDSGWDYLSVDPGAARLYVTRGDHVDVLDLKTEKVVGQVPDTAGVHGVALATDLGKGYCSDGLSGTVTVFDLKTLKVESVVPVGEHPDSIVYDSFSQRVFVFNGKSRDSSIIDAHADTVVATLALDAKPEFCASDGQGSVFVNLEDKDSIAAIDVTTLKLRAVWPLKAHGPSGLAIDRKHGLLFSVCKDNKMEVVDTTSGSVTAEVAIGGHPDAAAFDPGTQLAFSSNGEGNLTVAQEISPRRFAAPFSLDTQKGARTMALDTDTHAIYLISARYLSPVAEAAPIDGKAKAGSPHPRPRIEAGSVALLVLKKL